MAVVGQREAESDSLALRVRGAGKKQEVMPVDAFLAGSPTRCGPARWCREPRATGLARLDRSARPIILPTARPQPERYP